MNKTIDWQAYEEWYNNRNSVTFDHDKPVEFLGVVRFEWEDEDKEHVEQDHGGVKIGAYIPVRFIKEVEG